MDGLGKVDVVFQIRAYNAEKYLKKSIESILNQTHENIELILWNNGSTDSTYEIMQSYAKTDKRVHLINFKENWKPTEGEKRIYLDIRHSVCNSEYANYYAELDADDYYELDFVENCLKYSGADIYIGKRRLIYEKEELERYTPIPEINMKSKLSSEQFMKLYVYFRTRWGKLFKMEYANYFEEFNEIYKNPNIKYYCDTESVLNVLSNETAVIKTIDNFSYNYIIHSDSISFNKKIDDKLVDGSYINVLGINAVNNIVLNEELELAYNFIAFVYEHNYLDVYEYSLEHSEDSLDLLEQSIKYRFEDKIVKHSNFTEFKNVLLIYISNHYSISDIVKNIHLFVCQWYLMITINDNVLKNILYFLLMMNPRNEYNLGTSKEGVIEKINMSTFISTFNTPEENIDVAMDYANVGRIDEAIVLIDEVLMKKPFNKQALVLKLLLDIDNSNYEIYKKITQVLYGDELIDIVEGN